MAKEFFGLTGRRIAGGVSFSSLGTGGVAEDAERGVGVIGGAEIGVGGGDVDPC